MRSHTLTSLVLMVLVFLMASVSAEASDPSKAPCLDGRPVKENSYGSVRDYEGDFYVCSPRDKVRAMLGPSQDPGVSAHVVLVERVQLRGHYVAWVKSCYCDDYTQVDLYRLNLNAGPRKYVAPALDGGRIGIVLSLRLSRRGALAWIANDYVPSAPAKEVWTSDGPNPRQVSRGRDVRHLRIKQNTVTWTQDGRHRRHRLG